MAPEVTMPPPPMPANSARHACPRALDPGGLSVDGTTGCFRPAASSPSRACQCGSASGARGGPATVTKLGQKPFRQDRSTSCNVDLSCLKGFCPSFVTVAGPPRAPDADPHWQAREGELAAGLKHPVVPSTDKPPGSSARGQAWRALFAGIGGGGIVTSGAILAMAAHLEGKVVRTLDYTGLAQKNGTVVAHVQIADDEAALDVVRIPLGSADVMIAADLAVAAGPGVLERNASSAAVIGNLDLAATAAFKHDANLLIDAVLHRRTIERATDAGASTYLHAVRLAEHLFGNAQAMNTMLLGLAWQRGLIPVGEAAILRAIELNGAAVSLNRRAFLWGRILAEQPALEDEILVHTLESPPAELDALIEARAKALVAYQNTRLANRYRALVNEVVARETSVLGEPGRLSRAAAEGLYRVMAYKDEYEVARLHAAATYGQKPRFHLSPPLVTGIDPATGRRRKIALPGSVALPMFRVLRHGKVLRGTALDLFGRQQERRLERALIQQYIGDLRAVLAALQPDTLDVAVATAQLPDMIRGFGPVKEGNRVKAEEQRRGLLARLAAAPVTVAAE